MKISGNTKEDQAGNILILINTHETKFPSMTYEQGVEIALQWMLGKITDDEFSENF